MPRLLIAIASLFAGCASTAASPLPLDDVTTASLDRMQRRVQARTTVVSSAVATQTAAR